MIRPVAVSLILALAACANTPPESADGIASTNGAFEAAFNAGDSAALAQLYTADAAVLAPNVQRVEGRAAIQGLWQNFFDAGITGLDLTTDEIEMHQGKASEVGHFTLQAPDGQGGTATLHGKYIVLWMKDADGTWRLRRDIWNSDPAG